MAMLLCQHKRLTEIYKFWRMLKLPGTYNQTTRMAISLEYISKRMEI